MVRTTRARAVAAVAIAALTVCGTAALNVQSSAARTPRENTVAAMRTMYARYGWTMPDRVVTNAAGNITEVDYRLVASPAQHRAMVTVPTNTSRHRYTPGEVVTYARSAQVGPSSNTYGGVGRVTGWTKHGSGRSATWTAGYKIVNTMISPGVHPNSWYNPGSWHWSSIMGSVWTHVMKPCLGGAITGVVGPIVASQGEKAIIYMRGVEGASRTMSVTPQGLALLGVAGCVTGVVGSNLP